MVISHSKYKDELLKTIAEIRNGQLINYDPLPPAAVALPRPFAKIRYYLELSQSQFATLIGISVRTLQEWEQGRHKPSGPAQALLRVAYTHPEIFI